MQLSGSLTCNGSVLDYEVSFWFVATVWRKILTNQGWENFDEWNSMNANMFIILIVTSCTSHCTCTTLFIHSYTVRTVKPETLALLNFGETWFKEFWRNKRWWNAAYCCYILYPWWLWKVVVRQFDPDLPNSSKFYLSKFWFYGICSYVGDLENNY